MTAQELKFFWSRLDVDTSEPCWVWQGAKGGTAKLRYGVYLGTSAHRVAYEHFVGPIPAGMDLDHGCRLTVCVNPEHLEPVTRSVNLTRRGAAPWVKRGDSQI